MKLAVIGTGYVGLVTGTCFAETGNDVVCMDVDKLKVKRLKAGEIPIYEPGLENIFKRNIKEDRLHFTDELSKVVNEAEIIFLALPTPPHKDGSADLSYIMDVANKLGPLLKHYTIIVNKSTVPIGTAKSVRQAIGKQTKVDFDVVSNPEFLREGFAVEDFLKPDRIVIGSSSAKARKALEHLYKPFIRQGDPIYFMDEASAEMTKYVANAFLATKISFMNEVANLCELVEANVDHVRLGIGADERIGKRFLFAGIGYGGSCFPKDVKALKHIAKEKDYDFKLIKAVDDVNGRQKNILASKVLKYYGGKVSGKTFALWGLSFKPDTDDIREAPALEIIKTLTDAGANIVAYDPEASENVLKLHGNNRKLRLTDSPYKALNNADALLVATEWPEFRTPVFGKLKKLLKKPVIFDGRNVFDIEDMKNKGFHYESIGRAVVK